MLSTDGINILLFHLHLTGLFGVESWNVYDRWKENVSCEPVLGSLVFPGFLMKPIRSTA